MSGKTAAISGNYCAMLKNARPMSGFADAVLWDGRTMLRDSGAVLK